MNHPYTRTRAKGHHTLEERVAAVEQIVDHIQMDMTEMKHTLEAGFEQITDRMNQNAQNNKPQWGVWASWAAIVLLIISMFGSGYIRDITRLEDTTNITDTRLRAIESQIPLIESNQLAIREFDQNTDEELDNKFNILKEEIETTRNTTNEHHGTTMQQLLDLQRRVAHIEGSEKEHKRKHNQHREHKKE